ncbi:putative modulator of DNA gyrase, PmbA/TldD protein-like protein 1 [Thermococcus cleftensis]|uniref:Modulator of DNA gyrase, PmbA/TldD protein-like protein 1 n=1 Tax=Thermococcus cleftensis (strain DSM 27260 / KACC 17922 / CL1) TaxID=163003 RepID=I3ZUT7_THECF|nr:TldD/PmbA family protein [Thermococcus cleftensis]AFL95471.1 putative modulator of DNA gyrase, PmbA/TldD protein-like protein 1 [Thermococcus cleftensis]
MENLVRKAEALAERYGVSYYEIRITRVTASHLSIRNGQLDELSLNAEMGIGVRAFNGAWGFSSANDMTRAEEAIKTAMKIAKLSRGDSRIHLGDPVRERAEIKVRKPFTDIEVEDKLTLVKEIDSLLEGERIVSRETAYGDGLKEQLYFNSLGSEIETVVPRVRVGFSVTARENGEMQTYWRYFGGTAGWELVEDIDFPHWAELVKEKALSLLHARSPPSGEFEIIMDPELTGVFIHEALGHAVEADSVKNGDSILAGKLGERIAVEGLTVVDDPTLPGKYGSYVYDDEGIRGKRVEIIRDGVLVNYLNDRETSALLGLEPNGHGRAQGYAYQPLVRMSNTYVEPGSWSLEEMLEEVKNGLYMAGDKGGQVDTASGTFTFGATEGYIIENGEIKDMVRDVAMSGSILEVLRNIRAVGKELRVEFPGYCGKGQVVPVDDGGPHLLTRALVGGLR